MDGNTTPTTAASSKLYQKNLPNVRQRNFSNGIRGTFSRNQWLYLLLLFHRGGVFATARGAVALRAMKQGLLRRFHVGFFALPDFQSRLLYGAGK